MSDLSRETCEPCRVGAPKATGEEIRAFLEDLPGWEVKEVDGVKRIEKSYEFENFVEALEFTNRVGGIAEEHGHHPALLTEWGKTTVTWWTHKIEGLHRNDFIMAARTEEVRKG